jgi:hypothetical protein
MSDERDQEHYPAVEQLRAALRANLLRAAHTSPRARLRLSRRQRVGVLAAIGLATIPGGIALAELIDPPPEGELQCPGGEPPPDADFQVGVPADRGKPVVVEPIETLPMNPCE